MGIEQIKVKLNPDVQPTGSDLAVCNAARRSFNTRSEWTYDEVEQRAGDGEWITQKVNRHLKDKDKRLIDFLARGVTADDFEQFLLDTSETGKDWIHGEALYAQDPKQLFKDLLWQWRNTPIHDTPFSHCFISFEVQAPIFVARHLVKTEYTIFSEFSRRYITDDVEFYWHDYREVAKDKKQGSGGLHTDSQAWQEKVNEHNLNQLLLYNSMIGQGIAPEQARGVLPTDLITSWTWSGTLGAMAKMCRERLGPDVQLETRVVAQQVYDYLKQYYPVSAVALVEGVK